MKTPIRAARKPQRFFVPPTPFESESFDIRVRQVTRHISLPIGVSFLKLSIHRLSRQFKTMAEPIDDVHRTKILLPSTSLQGHGLRCSPLRARPVDHPAALSSRQFLPSAPNSCSTEPREPAQIALLSDKRTEPMEKYLCSSHFRSWP